VRELAQMHNTRGS